MDSKRAVIEMTLITTYDLLYFLSNIVFWVFLFVVVISEMQTIGTSKKSMFFVELFGWIWVLSRLGVLREYKYLRFSPLAKRRG